MRFVYTVQTMLHAMCFQYTRMYCTMHCMQMHESCDQWLCKTSVMFCLLGAHCIPKVDKLLSTVDLIFSSLTLYIYRLKYS